MWRRLQLSNVEKATTFHMDKELKLRKWELLTTGLVQKIEKRITWQKQNYEYGINIRDVKNSKAFIKES